MKRWILLLVLVAAVGATPVSAKEGTYIGLYFPKTDIAGEAGTGLDSGSGWGGRIGVGFGRYAAIEANYTSTSHDVTGGGSVDMKGVAVDFKLHFPLTSLDSAKVMTLEPYALIGYGMYDLGSPISASGSGLQLGVGIELYLFRELSINAGYTRTKVTFDTTPEADGTIRQLDFGVMYHFI